MPAHGAPACLPAPGEWSRTRGAKGIFRSRAGLPGWRPWLWLRDIRVISVIFSRGCIEPCLPRALQFPQGDGAWRRRIRRHAVSSRGQKGTCTLFRHWPRQARRGILAEIQSLARCCPGQAAETGGPSAGALPAALAVPVKQSRRLVLNGKKSACHDFPKWVMMKLPAGTRPGVLPGAARPGRQPETPLAHTAISRRRPEARQKPEPF